MTDQLTVLINKILKLNGVPNDWNTSILILLFKKCDKKEPENYRDKPVKHYYRTDNKNLIWINKPENNFGRLATEISQLKDTCTDTVFVIRQITEKVIE